MSTRPGTAVLTCAAALALLLTACSGSSDSGHKTASTNIGHDQSVTAAATKDVSTLTWSGDYRPVYSLDPIKNADYPEETILPNVCTSLLQLSPNNTLEPSLATARKQTSPTSVVFTIRSGVKFSDGSPLSVNDVVYSLRRNTIPADASSFADAYSQVKTISATGPHQVTVTFSRPNSIFPYDAATLGGAIVSQKYAEAKGRAFGSPQGGVLCAGPYKVASYDGTHDLTLTVNRYYWDTARKPKATTVHFVFAADPTALTNAIAAGTIQGAFDLPPTDIGPLRGSTAGKLFVGGSGSSPQNVDLVPSSVTKGPLADPRVRQALSMAIDRQAIATKVWSGAAQPLYAVAGPGLFGRAKNDYQPAYDKLVTDPQVTKAKKLIEQAGASGATVRLAYPSDVDYVTTLATYLRQVGDQIGLNVQLVGQSSSQFGNLFVDAGARAKVDAFITINYLEFPSPAAMIGSYATPTGFQNYEGYNNPAVTALVEKAYGTTDPSAQADAVNQAQAILGRDLPWIPLIAPSLTLFMARGITGAPLTFSFMCSPWLAQVGGT